MTVSVIVPPTVVLPRRAFRYNHWRSPKLNRPARARYSASLSGQPAPPSPHRDNRSRSADKAVEWSAAHQSVAGHQRTPGQTLRAKAAVGDGLWIERRIRRGGIRPHQTDGRRRLVFPAQRRWCRKLVAFTVLRISNYQVSSVIVNAKFIRFSRKRHIMRCSRIKLNASLINGTLALSAIGTVPLNSPVEPGYVCHSTLPVQSQTA